MEPSDFIVPTGELTLSMFPGKDLPAWVSQWIMSAQTQATADGVGGNNEAITHNVYWRAYAAALNAMMARANSMSTPDGTSISFTTGQRDYWERKAAEHKAAYDALVRPPAPPSPRGIEGIVTIQRRPTWW